MKAISILFVDDEINVLKSLRRSLLPTGYRVLLAKSFKEAEKLLAEEAIDILISDVKMRDGCGVALLKYVKATYPHIHRMILSGYVEEEHVLKTILNSATFDYLSKPWENDVLIHKIQHVVKIRAMLSNEDMRLLVNDIEQLPIIPEVYKRFEKAVEEEAPIEAIGAIISEDAGMSSKLLQLANTSFYSVTRVNSIQKAISIIGLKGVKQLMFAAIFLQEDDLLPWQVKELREIADVYARVNKFLSAYYYYCFRSKMREDYNVLGFTFDIGKLILLRYKPERYLKIIETMASSHDSFYNCESALGYEGASHREIGGYFLNLWNFSRVCIEASLFHHRIEAASHEFSDIIELVDIAHNSAMYDEEGYLEALDIPKYVPWDTLEFEGFKIAKKRLDRIKQAY